jgi:hypothetical protein
MPKNYSYVIKVEKICTKRYLEIPVVFIVLQFLVMIRLYFFSLGSSVRHFEQETHIFFQRFYQNFIKKTDYQIFLKTLFYQKLYFFLKTLFYQTIFYQK